MSPLVGEGGLPTDGGRRDEGAEEDAGAGAAGPWWKLRGPEWSPVGEAATDGREPGGECRDCRAERLTRRGVI